MESGNVAHSQTYPPLYCIEVVVEALDRELICREEALNRVVQIIHDIRRPADESVIPGKPS